MSKSHTAISAAATYVATAMAKGVLSSGLLAFLLPIRLTFNIQLLTYNQPALRYLLAILMGISGLQISTGYYKPFFDRAVNPYPLSSHNLYKWPLLLHR